MHDMPFWVFSCYLLLIFSRGALFYLMVSCLFYCPVLVSDFWFSLKVIKVLLPSSLDGILSKENGTFSFFFQGRHPWTFYMKVSLPFKPWQASMNQLSTLSPDSIYTYYDWIPRSHLYRTKARKRWFCVLNRWRQ